jgi:hypothetical protein
MYSTKSTLLVPSTFNIYLPSTYFEQALEYVLWKILSCIDYYVYQCIH